MAENTAPTPSAEAPQPSDTTRVPRTVTLPVLPLAIVAAVILAVIFFGGGVAVGYAIGDHPARVGIFQPVFPGRNGHNGGLNGLGGKGGNGGLNGGQHATPAPNNG